VLTAFPDLTTHAQGRDVLLVLSHEIGDVLLEAKNRDSEAFCLAKTAMIVRREILQVKNTFNTMERLQPTPRQAPFQPHSKHC